jgi:formate/nitrite transporter FocA (FNT family)
MMPDEFKTGPQEEEHPHAVTEQRLKEEGTQLTRDDLAEVEDRLRLRAALVYEIVRQEGEEELARQPISLWWSGVTAGLSIGFSVVAEGLLHAHLPDADWRPLIDNLGYSVGFLIVILAREQLFTENTLTAVLPLVASPSVSNLLLTLRLWGIVFFANMAGALVFALGLSSGHFFSGEAQEAFLTVSHHLLALDASQMFLRGIIAGWIIATLVWLLPSSGSGNFLVIVLLTYLIALAELAHVIAGSVEAFFLVFQGDISWSHAIVGFLLPALAGNIIGGSALFAILAYAQVREEI